MSKKKRKMASWDESEGLTDKFRLMWRFTYFSCLILNWKMASLFLRCETSKMVFLSGYCIGMTKVKKVEECEEELVFYFVKFLKINYKVQWTYKANLIKLLNNCGAKIVFVFHSSKVAM